MNRRIVITGTPGALTFTTLPDGSSVTVDGNFDYVVEDLDSYVQVALIWSTPEARTGVAGLGTRTFRDPSNQLVEGAYVKVPFGAAWAIGKVVKLGRGLDLPTERGDNVIALLSEQQLG